VAERAIVMTPPCGATAPVGDPYDGNIETAVSHQRLQRREDHLVGEIACRPEEDERIRAQHRCHGWFSP